MSGPTTVLLTPESLAIVLAAAAIRAAQAVEAGYQEAARLQDEHDASSLENRHRQSAASAAGQKALNETIERAEQRLAALQQLAAVSEAGRDLPATPLARPQDNSPLTLAAYIREIEARCRLLQDALDEAGSFRPGERQEEGIDAGILATAGAAAHSADTPSSPTDAVRLLARLAALGPLPDDIERLSREYETTENADRKELLGIELRRAIQRFEEQAVQEASAVVLEQTLKDLGYQVESVSDTLFVEGGVIHFRRQDWGDYQIRLRLNAQESTANFNVVRAVDAGNNERSVLDHIAEDRWCAEFPALLDSLAKRGLHLTVTRRLEAGELPVQLVDRDKLPRFADEETQAARQAPRQKEMQ